MKNKKVLIASLSSLQISLAAHAAEQPNLRAPFTQEKELFQNFERHAEGIRSGSLEDSVDTSSLLPPPPFPTFTSQSQRLAVASLTGSPRAEVNASLTQIQADLPFVILEPCGNDAYKISTPLKVDQTIDNLFYNQRILLIEASSQVFTPQTIQNCIENGTQKLFTLLSLDPANKDIDLNSLETALRYLFIIDNITHSYPPRRRPSYTRRKAGLYAPRPTACLHSKLLEYQERFHKWDRQGINTFFLTSGMKATTQILNRAEQIRRMIDDLDERESLFKEIGNINKPQSAGSSYKHIGDKLEIAFELEIAFKSADLNTEQEISSGHPVRTQEISSPEDSDPGGSIGLSSSYRWRTSTSPTPAVPQGMTLSPPPTPLTYNEENANLNNDSQILQDSVLSGDSTPEESLMNIIPPSYPPSVGSAENIGRKRPLSVTPETPSQESPLKKHIPEVEREIAAGTPKSLKEEMIARLEEMERKYVGASRLANRLSKFKTFFLESEVSPEINAKIEYYYKVALENKLGNQFFSHILEAPSEGGRVNEDAQQGQLTTSFMDYLDLIKRRRELINKQPSLENYCVLLKEVKKQSEALNFNATSSIDILLNQLENYCALLKEVKKQSEALNFNATSSIDILLNEAKEEKKKLKTVNQNIEELAMEWGYPSCFE